MRRRIVPLSEEHYQAAAALLAARHRAVRARAPELPARYETEFSAREAFHRALDQPGAAGVAALEDGTDHLVGYLIGSPAIPNPTANYAMYMRPRSARVGYAGHAVTSEEGYDTYRDLYAALAPGWLRRGLFAHYIQIPAGDTVAEEAWFSLGFGQDIAYAVRDTGPVAGDDRTPAGLLLSQAGDEDIAEVTRLAEELARYHSTAPIFFPFLQEMADDLAKHQRELLAEPANTAWLAHRDGRAVGMQLFEARPPAEMDTPERCVYLYEGYTEPGGRGGGVGTALLRRSMAWAREQGFDHCALHFMTANILGARFWQRSGFRPVQTRWCRVIDERIAWASAQ